MIAIYDFDGTLTPYPYPKYQILDKCGLTGGMQNREFLKQAKSTKEKENIDLYTAVYRTFFEILKSNNFKLTDENLSFGSTDVEYNTGVLEFLERLSSRGVKNYLLSSGFKVYLDRTQVAPYFSKIYGTTLTYDEHDEVEDIDYLMTDEKKVLAIKEILKENGKAETDCTDVVYIGDGLTDIYAMEYIKKHGGYSIFLCRTKDSEDVSTMKEKNAVNLFTAPDFSESSELNNNIDNLYQEFKKKETHNELYPISRTV